MHSLSADHQTDWHFQRLEHQGYTVVPDAIVPELLARLRRRFDELVADYENVPTAVLIPRNNAVDLNRIFELDPVFEELMNLPSVFPIAQRLLSGDITLYSAGEGNFLPARSAARGGWHHDGIDLVRLTFLLSDLAEDGGATAVFPGSHHADCQPPQWVNTDDYHPRELPGMERITGKAGSCLINSTRLWHTSTPNTSDEPRRLIWVLYKRTALQVAEQEHLRMTPEFMARQTDSQRRLLCGAA